MLLSFARAVSVFRPAIGVGLRRSLRPLTPLLWRRDILCHLPLPPTAIIARFVSLVLARLAVRCRHLSLNPLLLIQSLRKKL